MKPVVTVLLALLALAACGQDDGRAAEGYCGRIGLHLDLLNSPALDDEAAISEAIDIYRTIVSVAPVAVEPEWQQLLTALETADTVDPGDQDSVQRAVDTARSSKRAAVRVQQYTAQTCDLQIDDPPPVTNPVTATTSTLAATPENGQGAG